MCIIIFTFINRIFPWVFSLPKCSIFSYEPQTILANLNCEWNFANVISYSSEIVLALSQEISVYIQDH